MTARVGCVNAMGASPRVTPARSARIVNSAWHAAAWVDALVVVEASDIRIGSGLWLGALQFGDLGSPESALGVLFRAGTSVTGQHLVEGTPARNRRGRRQDIRERPILLFDLEVDGEVEPMAAIHAPPPRMPLLRRRYMRRVRQVTRGRTVVGDFNLPRSALRRMFPAAQIVSEGPRRRDVLHIVARAPRGAQRVEVVATYDLDGNPDHAMPVGRVGKRDAL